MPLRGRDRRGGVGVEGGAPPRLLVYVYEKNQGEAYLQGQVSLPK
jgi:hypothetical protein